MIIMNNTNEMVITPLGTVSPYCKDEKNCPGFLVNYNDTKVLLDCGNGISRLLKFPDDLTNLTIIITHLHNDHYGDLLSLAYASYVYNKLNMLDKRVKVYIPIKDDNNLDENFINIFGDEHYFEFCYFDENTKLNIDDVNITFAENPHQIKCYSIKLQNEISNLVYSGDTGFEGNNLVTFAKEVDILICESTFLKGQIREKDYHLYAHEAATIAKEANVEKLVLTHFWPDIDKSKYLEEASEIFRNTIVAEEGKKIVLRK